MCFARVPAVGRGSDFRRARSASTNVRQFSHSVSRSLKLVVIEFGQIASRTVVKELEEIVHGFAPRRVDMTYRNKTVDRLRSSEFGRDTPVGGLFGRRFCSTFPSSNFPHARQNVYVGRGCARSLL